MRGDRSKVNVHTPLGYFMITNPDLKGFKAPWNSDFVEKSIRSHLAKFGLVYESKGASDFLPQGGATKYFSQMSRRFPGRSVVLLLPSYFPECEQLAFSLNGTLRGEGGRAECGNTSALSEKIVKNGFKKWDAYITPLSPGDTSKDSIQNQYFSPSSSSSYLGKAKDSNSFFTLIGVGQTFLVVKKGSFCGIKPNVLGVGDILISNLQRCD
jgi:hypothetical protein